MSLIVIVEFVCVLIHCNIFDMQSAGYFRGAGDKRWGHCLTVPPELIFA